MRASLLAYPVNLFFRCRLINCTHFIQLYTFVRPAILILKRQNQAIRHIAHSIFAEIRLFLIENSRQFDLGLLLLTKPLVYFAICVDSKFAILLNCVAGAKWVNIIRAVVFVIAIENSISMQLKGSLYFIVGMNTLRTVRVFDRARLSYAMVLLIRICEFFSSSRLLSCHVFRYLLITTILLLPNFPSRWRRSIMSLRKCVYFHLPRKLAVELLLCH